MRVLVPPCTGSNPKQHSNYVGRQSPPRPFLPCLIKFTRIRIESGEGRVCNTSLGMACQ
jgi:hypothetical protein